MKPDKKILLKFEVKHNSEKLNYSKVQKLTQIVFEQVKLDFQ